MNISLLLVTALFLIILAAACFLPVHADSPDDEGDGRTTVKMPRWVKTPPHRPRTWAFMALATAFGLIFLGWQHPSLPAAYSAAVSRVAVGITNNPASVNGYISRLRPALAFFALTYILAIAAVIRADPLRRVVVAAHGALYLAMSILSQALMIVAGIATGWPVGPFGVEATLMNLLVGGVVIIRLTFTTFMLPRGTTVGMVRRRRLWDTLLTWCALISTVCLLIAAYAFISQQAKLTSDWQVFLPLYAVSLLFTLMYVPLWLLWWVNRKLPLPDPAHRPPLDVIIPCYNEAENLSRLLASIDIAAERYGGPVWIVVADDGSADGSREIAAAELALLEHASGTVVTGPNGGVAVTLNRGMEATHNEIVVRIDGDCVMGPDALVYTVPWFRDPSIGMVGGMEEPRTDTVTWFHRLRVLETMFQFRFARLGASLVDGIFVIPGTYMACRRGPAREAGYYPTNMNGEDADITMQVGRRGYRVVVDPRIRSFEDVPRSPGEFVEQRTRWSRAGFHVFARHVPLRSGSAGPRVWFWTMHRGFAWFPIQAGLVAPIFMTELALTSPSYRQNVVTLFLLYVLGGAVSLAFGLPYAVKYRYWRSILWAPTWFAYAFLRRLASLEAVISLPTRPLLPGYDAAHRNGAEPRPAAVATVTGADS